MDGSVLYFEQGNDIVVTARFPDISDGTGSHAEFIYKDNRYVADTDPTTQMYSAPIVPDPDFPGATMSQFSIPADDNLVTGAFWWRVDCIDSLDTRRTAQCGTLLVEAVLWKSQRQVPAARKGSCITGLKAQDERSSIGECQAISIAVSWNWESTSALKS